MGIAVIIDLLLEPPAIGSGSGSVTPATPVAPSSVDSADQTNILGRLQALLPNRWFPVGASPIKDAIMTGAANALAAVLGMLNYLRLQTRISTATDGFLDMASADFFGDSLSREVNESDASFRNRILINLLRPRGTRASVSNILQQLTGNIPVIVEPRRPADCGGYGLAYGYGVGGAYGSMLMPFQSFVQAFRSAGFGVANASGYGDPGGGYSTNSQLRYLDLTAINTGPTDQQIIDAVESVRPVGYTIWLNISNAPSASAVVTGALLADDGTELTADDGTVLTVDP